jgi:uncharacterized protein (TIGR02246 family)
MRTFRTIATAVLVIASLTSSIKAQGTRMLAAAETQEINATLQRLEDAWNHNDMPGYAAQLTDDCSWINIVGMHWDGKAAVMKAHTAYLSTMFKDVMQYPLDTKLSYVAPGIALAVRTFRIGDFRDPTGKLEKDMHDRMTLLLVKQPDGRWLIRAAHNTTINPIAAQFDPAK